MAARSDCLLFVYGTLMRGEANADRMRGARHLQDAVTRPLYTLVDLGAYPALLIGGRTAIAGELYEVDAALLAALDDFEGVPTLYERRLAAMDDDRGTAAWTYVLARAPGSARVISSGRWRSRTLP